MLPSMRHFVLGMGLIAAVGRMGTSLPRPEIRKSWKPEKAANYLEARMDWWIHWPAAARGRGTFCVSCHTAVPYALARPALSNALHETSPSPHERELFDSVTTRVRFWRDVQPFYHDAGSGPHKTAESRGTEAVLNALLLASRDARNGHLSEDARLAFRNMWSLQQVSGKTAGAWDWLQFDNEPFEGHDSGYYGAALAAVAVGMAPESYRSNRDIRQSRTLLRDYLTRQYSVQSPINQVVLLWASSKWPELLSAEARRSLLDELGAKQRTDGGWNLASLAWTSKDWEPRSLVKMFLRSYGTPLGSSSDGYATALIAFVLHQVGMRDDEPHLMRAVAWLRANQNAAEGFWQSYSLNNRRDPKSLTGRFMSDAATAYAVLALTGAN